MRKICAVLLLSVFLLCGGCALSKKPKVSVLPKCTGTVFIGESAFGIDVDFCAKPETITIHSADHAFDTVYTFEGKSITLQYDEIVTHLDLSALPDTNTASLVYKLMHLLINEKIQWEKNGSLYHFYGTLNGTAFSGECDKEGKIRSFEIPLYKLYFKAKNFTERD